MNTLSHIPCKTITSGYRPIEDGSRFNPYFPPPDERDRILIKDGEVTDTVELMEKVVWKYLDDTRRIAPLLQRSSTIETCRAIWDFVRSYIQYKLDKKGLEQLRRPARTWAERQTGVDCDCMSIFISSILVNLKIPHSFRITKYNGDSWQHVYVIVPLADSNKICAIDAVISEFNYEKHYTDKMDYTMNLKGIDVAVLSGVSGNDHYDAVMATTLMGESLGAASDQQDLDKIYQNIVATRNAIAQNPSLVSTMDDPKALLQMLDYAIQYWYTEKRDEALDILAKNEHQLNLRNGLTTINGIGYDPDDFVLSGVSVKGFFTGVKNAVQKTTQKVGQAIKPIAQAAVKAIVKFNPLSLAARGGFLLAMKLNLGKMASKLKWAYGTKEQALAKGVPADQWQKSKNAMVKVEKLFADKLQGSKTALKNSILNGRAGNLNGIIEGDFLGHLGDPASATAIAAATPVIIATIQILKESGLIGKNENVDINALTKEVISDPKAAEMAAEIQSNENSKALVPNQAPYQTPGSESSADSGLPPTAGGLMNFIKNNPVPSALGAGLLVAGIYMLTKPGKKNKGLSGIKSTRHTIAHKKPNNKHKLISKKTSVKSIKLF